MDRYEENMTSGPLHLATVGRHARHFFCYIDFYMSLDRWQTFVQYDIRIIITVSELNSSLAFCYTLRLYRIIVLTHDHFIFICHCVSYLFFTARSPARIKLDRQQLLLKFHMLHNVQVIPNLWKVSQNDQTVHSGASLLSCYLCQLTWWVGPLKK